MQCLPLTPHHRLIKLHTFLLALALARRLKLTLTHMGARKTKQVASSTDTPINALYDFPHGKRGKIAVHALFQLLGVVGDRGVDGGEGEAEFGEGGEAGGEAVYEGC